MNSSTSHHQRGRNGAVAIAESAPQYWTRWRLAPGRTRSWYALPPAGLQQQWRMAWLPTAAGRALLTPLAGGQARNNFSRRGFAPTPRRHCWRRGAGAVAALIIVVWYCASVTGARTPPRPKWLRESTACCSQHAAPLLVHARELMAPCICCCSARCLGHQWVLVVTAARS